jgi:hypothetical protein
VKFDSLAQSAARPIFFTLTFHFWVGGWLARRGWLDFQNYRRLAAVKKARLNRLARLQPIGSDV